jgi:SnoaL-like domain
LSEDLVRTALRPRPLARPPDGVSPDELLELPAGSPDRTAFLTDRIFGAAEAYVRRDLGALLRYYHPNIEVVIAELGGGGLWGGDFDASYRGHERFLELTELWLDAWDDLRLEPDELIDGGGAVVALFATWIGRGKGSGAEVTTSYQARQTRIGDQIARVEFWADRETALRALGLHPQV